MYMFTCICIYGVFGISGVFERDAFICDMTQQSTAAHHLHEPVYSARERERERERREGEREREREREREKENERRTHTAVEYLGSLAQYLCSLQHDGFIRDMTQPSAALHFFGSTCILVLERRKEHE